MSWRSINRIIMIIVISCLTGPILHPALNHQASSKIIYSQNNAKDFVPDSLTNNEKLIDIKIVVGNQVIKRYVTKENALMLKKALDRDDRVNILQCLKQIELTEEDIGLVNRLYTKHDTMMKVNYQSDNISSGQYFNNSFCKISGNITGVIWSTFDELLLSGAMYLSGWEEWGDFWSPFVGTIAKKIKNLFFIPFYIHTHRPYRFPILVNFIGDIFYGTFETKGLEEEWIIACDFYNQSAYFVIFGFIGVLFQINLKDIYYSQDLIRYYAWDSWFTGYCIGCHVVVFD